MATIIEKQVIETQHIHQDIPPWVQVRLDRVERKLDKLAETLNGFLAGQLSPENQAKVDALFKGVTDNIAKVAAAVTDPEVP